MSCKILVISDTHGNQVKTGMIIKKEAPFDCLVHCGDGIGDLEGMPIPVSATVIKVPGNVDLYRYRGLDRIETAEICGRSIMVVHGDIFGVHSDYAGLIDAARERDVDIVFFGHTHVPLYREGSPVLFNPGTVTNGSYGVVTLPGLEGGSFVHKNILHG
ncbi:MAG TPA: YfcE family phosphodiesterase [Spirochaetota bacterium]|nr:YfcE family phosphodiesterase [Spirochaetota bacterium]HRZ25480.1 YfcE family phosphodiesterase [Spirochaetota bacterium]HSA14102.1 YfcE family phosphodiesterase [Spirochaetota bacterium]